MTNQEQKKYNKKNASFSVYYDTLRLMFTTRKWNTLKNKKNAIYVFYLNGVNVIDAFTLIRKILNKK